MSPYLLLGFLVAGVLSVVVSPELVERHLGGKGVWPLVKAAAFGVPLPLCSCGVIPVTMSLRKHGASKAAAISFLLSTPQTGVDSILVTYSLLGPVFAVFRPVAALLTGLFGGVVVSVADRENAQQERNTCGEECCSGGNKPPKLVRMLRHGFVVLPRDIGGSMLVGLVTAAGISAVVPDDFFGPVLGGGIVAMVVMMLLGIPMYVCATASVPIAVSLIEKGVSPGAAMVFLMTGPATNAAALATIWGNLGSRTAVAYLGTVMVSAMGAGLMMDGFFPGVGEAISTHYHGTEGGFWGNIAAFALLCVLGWGALMKWKNKKAVTGQQIADSR